jgi:hypothetical membrane protein
MIQKELEQLSATPRDLRKFGLLVGGVFLLLGCWSLFRHKPLWPYLLVPGVLLAGLGVFVPRSLRRIHRVWMATAFLLGFVVSTTLLTLFYYLVVTPIGLIARLCGRDFLSLKLKPRAESCWLPRDQGTARTPAEYEQQF